MAGKKLDDPPQLGALLLHFAGEAVHDVYESLHVTFAAGKNVYLRTETELDKQFTVQASKPYKHNVFRQMAQHHDETVAQFVTKLYTQVLFL